MTKAIETNKKTGKKGAKGNARSDRLAAALRENLRRRKAQVRGRDASSPQDKADEPKSS